MNYKRPDPIKDTDGKDDFTEGEQPEVNLQEVPQTKTLRQILRQDKTLWEKAVDVARDTWLGRNTVGMAGGILLDLAGLAFPQLDRIRQKGKKLLHVDQRKFKYNNNISEMDKPRLLSKTVWSAILIAITALLDALGVKVVDDPMLMQNIYHILYGLTGAFGLYGLRDAVGKNIKEQRETKK